jgi:EsV-1-7 cysteine-rich motif
MIYINGKRCIQEGCKRHPCFNTPGSKTALYCSLHCLDGMVNIRGKRCFQDGCIKHAHFNIPGSKTGLYCSIHCLDGMVNVKYTRCIGQEGRCFTSVSNNRYRGYCLFCFMHTFPDEPVLRNYKTKEVAVVERVRSCFPNFTWRHDKRVECGISKRRPDLFLDLGSHVLVVEVDEDSHASYDCSCENKRLMQLSEDVDHRPLVMIRFNPDTYMDSTGNKRPSCWVRNGKGLIMLCKKRLPDWNIRLAELVRTIGFWAAHVPDKTLEVIELYMSDC